MFKRTWLIFLHSRFYHKILLKPFRKTVKIYNKINDRLAYGKEAGEV